MATICIFGDSITWGASDPEAGGWATRLRNMYGAADLPVDQDVDVYNLGISGDNTDDLLARFDGEAKARKPSSIIFAIGINDSQFVISKNQNRIPLPQFERNLHSLLNKAQAFTSTVAFIGLTPVDEAKTVPIPWNTDKTYTKENRDTYTRVIEKFCEANSLPYLDMSNVISLEELPDGLHPNSLGHQKMFNAISKFIKAEGLDK